MASGKMSEGIALLSGYGDEDDEMEDLHEEKDNSHEDGVAAPASDAAVAKENDGVTDHDSANMPQQQEDRGFDGNSAPSKPFNNGSSSASPTPRPYFFSPQGQQQEHQEIGLDLISAQAQRSRLAIVDYGHEEGAMSPDAEEGEIMATGRVMYSEQLQFGDGEFRDMQSPGIARLPTPSTQEMPPQALEPTDQAVSDAMEFTGNESESGPAEDAVMTSVEGQNEMNPLDMFLPPPPEEKCSEELQEKIVKFLQLKKTTGRSYNAEVRKKKEYRNPDFLQHAVTYQDIDPIGSNFSRDVFDPHGYDKSDFYDEIEADMRRQMERKEQERKKNQKLDFAPGGVLPGNVVPIPNISVPTPAPGLTAVAGGVSNVTPATSDALARDIRKSKKSKWDKVDTDQRSSMTSGVHGSMSAVGAHAAVLSTTKSGGGYSGFAQQRRKEAEDRRSSDKKPERRS